MSTKLNVIAASTRPGRVGAQVADWFVAIAREHGGFEVELVDLAELGLPFLDEPSAAIDGLPYEHEHTRKWSELTRSADAFVFISPEYNHSYSAPLKNALDTLYYEWNHKPAAFLSYGMRSGGMRAVEAIIPVVTALKMMPITETVVMHLREVLDAHGRLHPTSTMDQSAKSVLDGLLPLAHALKPLRA